MMMMMMMMMMLLLLLLLQSIVGEYCLLAKKDVEDFRCERRSI